MNKVAVVGYGMIDSLGNNPEDCFAKMLDDTDYSRVVPALENDPYCDVNRGGVLDPASLVFDDTFNKKEMRSMTNAQKMMLYATEYAMKMSGLPRHEDVATLMSTVSNDTEFLEEYYPQVYEQKKGNLRKMVNRIPDMGCYHITDRFGFRGLSTATFASCATGIVTLDYGMRLVDEYEYIVAGGADAGCFGMGIKYFTSLQATANKSMPFDDNRQGFMMGDGCGVMILMSEAKVKEYGATVHAWLYPAGHASDGVDLTNPEGSGTRKAMRKAVKDMKIDAICGHATSTPNGDPVEYAACVELFGDTPIWAPKSKVGHTLAAAGILESIYSILTMKHRTLPHIQNLEKCSFDDKGILVTENQPLPNKTLRTLNNSFGFGGKCMSQVIEVTG
jgi:3-oxoacyl-[acyl-carrier-protein] synthase II